MLAGAKLRISLGIKSKCFFFIQRPRYITNEGKERMWCSELNYSNYQSGKWCPLGAFGQGCFYTQVWEEKESLWSYNYIFLKMFFLTSGLILMSYVPFCKTASFKTLFSYWWKSDGQICVLSGTLQCMLHSEYYYITLVNEVHINSKIYILTPYSGYFGKIPSILSSRIIKIYTNIKLY